MTMRLNKAKLRGDMGIGDKPAIKKPPTASKRVESLKKALHGYIPLDEIDSTVMTIAATGLSGEEVAEMLKAGFSETKGSAWRKIERMNAILRDPELSVAAMDANITEDELVSLLEGKKQASGKTLQIMAKLQRRTNNHGPKSEEKKNELSSETLRQKMGRR